VVSLATRAPFHLEATVRVLQRRPANAVDLWERGAYKRVLTLSRGDVLIEVRSHGTVDNPAVRLSIRAGDSSAKTWAEAGAAVRRILGLDIDPAPLQRIVSAQRSIRTTCRALRGMRPPRFASLFESFGSIVPFQQLSLDAGIAIVARLVMRFGSRLEHDGRQFRAFPTARRVAKARVASLRSCGLSQQKALTLIGLARLIEAGELIEADLAGMSTDAALARLTALPGIGPWSAGLVLLRGLGRLDVFPPGDVGAARGLRTLTGLDSSALERFIARFGENRGYLYFCALGASLLSRGYIHSAPRSART
jgi:3-methyladenine DNA glycosylase/8-oxoguanine DNA glycosylase